MIGTKNWKIKKTFTQAKKSTKLAITFKWHALEKESSFFLAECSASGDLYKYKNSVSVFSQIHLNMAEQKVAAIFGVWKWCSHTWPRDNDYYL